MKFGGQMSKNVHDVRKVCLQTTLCVWACFIEFYVFVLDEIHVRGPKLIYEHIWVGNVWAQLHVGPIRGPRKRTPTWSSTLQGSGNRLTQTTASRPGDDP